MSLDVSKRLSGADPEILLKGGGWLNYGAEMAKEVLLRCERILTTCYWTWCKYIRINMLMV